MKPLLRSYPVPRDNPEALHAFLQREWLLTNGLGGYASGTLAGNVSRRYHGLLIAALPAPLGRAVMFNHLAEALRLPDGSRISLAAEQASTRLVEVRFEYQLPIWRFECEGIVVEKRILLVNGQNTLHVHYELLDGADQVGIELRPSFQFRRHEADVSQPVKDYGIRIYGHDFEIWNGPEFPPLRMMLRAESAEFHHDGGSIREVSYAHEAERGYSSRGQLWSPGYFLVPLNRQRGVTLIASTETWEIMRALRPSVVQELAIERRRHLLTLAGGDAIDSTQADLTIAADQFIITPVGRVEDSARARAIGDEVRTVIAGYHWFTDWGRDTMISLEGLTLATGRHSEAGWILRTFAHHIRDGLIPNLFPEGENEGLYHTADATLWFFHALDRYVSITGDQEMLALILPKMSEIIAAHEHGTRFGIRVDPNDGLLSQGEAGYQLTWMDAKVDNWVVTPRRGKAVEINALWHNALCLMEKWLRERGDTEGADAMRDRAARVRESFNARFWNPTTGHLYDVIDGEAGNDPACRPNQIFSISLPHAVLAPDKWEPVLNTVRDRLLTPYGLRSLDSGNPDYKSRYFGDLRARDAAYHQGTVWAWLIGPYIDAWLRVHPDDRAAARGRLEPLVEHLNDAGLCSISEIFDAESPFHPRGCIAQAWSVAEVLRCWKALTQEEAPSSTAE